MIQFNLLPDVKLEYMRAKRLKRLVMLLSGAVSGVAIFIFVLLFFTVNVLQKQHLGNLTKDISQDSKRLLEIQDLDKILTIQNQLNKMTELHDGKAMTSRLKTYISQVTPQNVSYAEVEVKVDESSMRFKGSADTLRTINQFVDTLKFTTYKNAEGVEVNAFSDVVLIDFGRDEKGASYEIEMKYDAIIFGTQSKIDLVVPNIITTRSVTEKPGENLFQPLSNPEDLEE